MIKLIIFDVDGTLTNGKLYIGNNGEVFKAFDIKDGLAIHDILPKHNIKTAIITGRQSQIVELRAKELNINYIFQNCKNKIEQLKELTVQLGIANDEIAYVGDDLNDIDCMSMCGLKCCPADAVEEVKSLCDYIAVRNGGDGAVREIIEWIVKTINRT